MKKERGKLRRKGERTRAKILKVAKKLFSQKGFAGVSIDEIAERVGIKKPSLYHYFESKLSIYEEIVRRAMEELSQIFKKSFMGKDVISGAKDLLQKLIDFAVENEEYVKMLVRESLDENLPIERLTMEYLPPVLNYGISIFEKGKENGVFKKDIDPIYLSIAISGSIIFYFAMLKVVKIYIKNPLGEKEIKKLTEQLFKIFTEGIISSPGRK